MAGRLFTTDEGTLFYHYTCCIGGENQGDACGDYEGSHEEGEEICSEEWCTSPWPQRGALATNCWAGTAYEPCSCSEGEARMTGMCPPAVVALRSVVGRSSPRAALDAGWQEKTPPTPRAHCSTNTHAASAARTKETRAATTAPLLGLRRPLTKAASISL